MGQVEGAGWLRVSVAFSPRPGEVDETVMTLATGSTVRHAIESSGLQARHPEFDLSSMPAGIWGAVADPGRLLRERDRVELYRPLKVDPKEARRLRYRNSTGTGTGTAAGKRVR